jgi:hypothetical protein
MLSDDTTITFFADQKNVNKDKVYWGDNTTYAEADIEAYAGLITFDTHIDYDAPEGSVVVGQMRYDKLLDYERKFWWTPDTTKDLPTLVSLPSISKVSLTSAVSRQAQQVAGGEERHCHCGCSAC